MNTDTIRTMGEGDVPGIARVFHMAVMQGSAAHYDAAQRLAWAGSEPAPLKWQGRLASLDVIVAVDATSAMVGFASLRGSDGLLDHLFVLPSRQRTGLADRLYRRIEEVARDQGCKRLWAEASLLARPFLQRQGWHVTKAQEVPVRGQVIRNFVMEYRLA